MYRQLPQIHFQEYNLTYIVEYKQKFTPIQQDQLYSTSNCAGQCSALVCK